MALLTDLQIQILSSALHARYAKKIWLIPMNIARAEQFQPAMEDLLKAGYLKDFGTNNSTMEKIVAITPAGFYAIASSLGLIPVCTFE